MRIILAGAQAQERLHLRRILAAMPGIEVVGHLRPGPTIDHEFRRLRGDIVLIDAADSGIAAAVLEAASRHRDVKPLVLIPDGTQVTGVARVPNLPRPATLAGETSTSPFGVALHRKLGVLQPAGAHTDKPSVAPPLLRQRHCARPELIAIGSSTGGPQALPEVLAGIAGRVPQAIVITQHMPPTFTRMLAGHLSRYTTRPTVEAAEAMPICPGNVYVAGGGKHLLVVRKGEQLVCQLDDGPEENFCRPAVDPMLRSVTAAVGGKALAIILTGMGQDGLAGCRKLVDAGGSVIAQGEATSVVWGMPGAVAQAGLCRAVLPLNRIAEEIIAAAGPGL